jgi:hypothetical protein
MRHRLTAFVASLSTIAFPAWTLDQGRSTAHAVAVEHFAVHSDISIDEFFPPKGMTFPAQVSGGTDRCPLAYALRFFDGLPRGDVGTALRAIRPRPVTAEERRRIRATLPAKGDVTPTPRETIKLDGLRTVFVYHQRHDVFDIKVIDIPQAYVGLHGRAILVISRRALRLLSASQLQAVVAHEIAHDFFWGEFQLTLKNGDLPLRHQLELQCDGIAVLTLIALNMDPWHLNAGVMQLVRYNEGLGATADAAEYPPPTDRRLLVSILVGSWGDRR